jgi:TonB family protein
MKILGMLFFLSAGTITSFAQTENVIEVEDNKTYTVVDAPPEYPGGYEPMMSYIKAELKYPEKSRKERIQGTVFVQFTVMKDGTLANFMVIRGINDELDKEAVRVLKGMPNWKPGTEKNKPVNVKFVLPVKYAMGW